MGLEHVVLGWEETLGGGDESPGVSLPRNPMAAAPTLLRVRVPCGPYKIVELVPGLSSLDVKEAVAGALRLAVGTFILESDEDGRAAGFHAGLTGDWTAVLLPAPPATQGRLI